MKHMPLAVSVLAAFAIFAATPAHSQDIEIGVAAAINPDVTGTPPDQEKRLLLVGANVFHNERVVTGEKGQTQMLFVDQSALTIGPDSEVVLDEFVYDPDTETGTIVLNATKGLFRLVGGKISKDGPVVLNTPTATIGIRGGIILVNIAETGATEATFLFGQSMQITSADVTREVTRPGFAVSVIAADLAPSEPAPVSAESLDAALGGLEGSEGESGGAEDTPEDSDVAASGIGEAGSDQDPADIAPGDGATDFQGLANSADNAEDTAEQDEASQNTATQSSTSVNVTGLSGRYKHSNSGGSSLGTGDGGSTFDVAYSGGAITSGTFSVDALSLTPFLKIPGITVGSFSFANAGTTSQFGSINGTGFLTSDQEFVFFEFFEADFSSDRLVAFAGVPSTTFTPTTLNALGTKFYSLQNDFVLDSSIPFVSTTFGGGLTPGEAEGAADTAIVFDASGSTTAQRAWGHRTIAIVVVGSETVGTRTTRRMFGYSGGAFQTHASGIASVSSTTIFRNATGDPKDIEVFTSAETNKVSADIDVVGFTLGSGTTTSTSGPFEVLNTDFGDDDTAFADSSAISGNSVFVDNATFGAADSDTTPAVFVSSSNPVTIADLDMIRVESASEFSNGFLPSGVTVCDCNFLTWGFWNADIGRSTGSAEFIHLANWVAGTVPTAAEIVALTGTASYSGHAIATVFNAGGVYQAIGNFTTTVDFGAETLTGAISAFDGGNFVLSGGAINTSGGSTLPGASSASNLFSSSIVAASTDPGTATGRSGSLVGSFMSGAGLGGDISSDMGGHFQIEDGSTYSASGIFAAAK